MMALHGCHSQPSPLQRASLSRPSPFEGEGGSCGTHETDEGFATTNSYPKIIPRSTTPSSGAARHLLPQGEKGVSQGIHL